MSQNGVCIRSVFEQKIGPYKVCIFVNMGPYEKLAALQMYRFSMIFTPPYHLPPRQGDVCNINSASHGSVDTKHTKHNIHMGKQTVTPANIEIKV